MSKERPPAPAVFDDALFDFDVERASDAGADIARAARKRFEGEGIPRDELRLCEAEGAEGNELPHCLKVYLPLPPGASEWCSRWRSSPVLASCATSLSASATIPASRTPKASTRSRTGPSQLAFEPLGGFGQLRDRNAERRRDAFDRLPGA